MVLWVGQQGFLYEALWLSHLCNLVLFGLHTLELLLFSCRLALLNLFLILLLKELTLGSLLQVGDLLKLDPVLTDEPTNALIKSVSDFVPTEFCAFRVCLCAYP